MKHPITKIDSVSLWIKSSKNTSLTFKKRKLYLKKSYDAIKFDSADTSVTRILSQLAYQYFELKDTTRFKEINKESYELALKIKDTFALADVHWNNANYYNEIEAYDKAYFHYNKAYNYFEKINRQYYAAKMLYGMSIIKGIYKDYSGSEILIVKAISKYKNLKKYKSLYASYNFLALIQRDIKEYDKSLFYHEKALEYLAKLKDKKDFRSISLNNIGLVYVDKGEYIKAIRNFDEILESNKKLRILDIEHYARVIDNRAYCKLLNLDTINVKKDLYESLKIRDSIKSKGGLVMSKIHLSEYFATVQDTINALNFAKEANALSGKLKNSRDYLASLKLLSKLDTENAHKYLKKFIAYNDSLQEIDRKVQNKFTRIAFETDEYIEETKRLSQQKMQLLISSFGVLAILSLIYYIKIQKTRNEKLVLEMEQHKSNEQVYLLTLNRQAKLEEEKNKERNRISEELHDGILGSLFGIRIGLGFLELNGDKETLNEHQMFLEELQDVEKEIREVSHKLNNNFSRTDIDFSVVLTQLLENKNKIGDFTCHLNVSENIVWQEINEVVKVNLYRILQEVLQNIVKYASANRVNLDFSIEQENLIVYIADDGVGFNPKKVKKGIGIKNMKSRVTKLRGTFNLRSEKNKGTVVHINIPIR